MGDKVFLRVALMKGVMRLGKKGKLTPRYISLFEILERIGAMAYRLTTLTILSYARCFHISMLRKYILDPSHVLEYAPLQVREDFSYEEAPTCILDKKIQVLRNKTILIVKVLCNHHSKQEATWEREEDMRNKYPYLYH